MNLEIDKYISDLDKFIDRTDQIKSKMLDNKIIASIDRTKLRLLALKNDLTDVKFRNMFCGEGYDEKEILKGITDEYIRHLFLQNASVEIVNEKGIKIWMSYNNLRDLLLNLHMILWRDANWEPITEDEISNRQDITKYYKKALAVVHPDKVDDINKNIAAKLYNKLVSEYKKLQ